MYKPPFGFSVPDTLYDMLLKEQKQTNKQKLLKMSAYLDLPHMKMS